MKLQRSKRVLSRLAFHYHLIIAAGTLSLIAIFIAYLNGNYRQYISTEQEKLKYLDLLETSRTHNLFNNLLITMKLLDEWIQNNPDQDPRFNSEFLGMVEIYRNQTGRRIDIRMVTKDGGLFYIPSKDSTPLTNVKDREYFQAIQNIPDQTLFFAKPVKSRVTQKWGIPISFKLRENPHQIHLLFAAVEFPYLDELYKHALGEKERSISILREDKTMLFRVPYDPYLIGNVQLIGPGTSGVVRIDIKNPEKNVRLILFNKVEELPIYVLLGDSYDRIYGEWWTSAFWKIAMFLTLISIFLVFYVRSILLMQDLSSTRAQLEKAARYDSLTGLKNRAYFWERSEEEIERARRYHTGLVMLLFDIDHFKMVNDLYGHPQGDQVLIQIANTIDQSIRGTDFSGRIGGEEFAVLLTATGLEYALEIAERTRKSVETIKMEDWKGGVSIGLAELRPDESIDMLYKRTDEALYKAKREGRNRVVAFREPRI